MTEDSPNDLSFGHSGNPAYDLRNKKWAFARTAYGSAFRQLDNWRIVIPTVEHLPSPLLSRTFRTAQNATKTIIRDCPSLVPAANYVPELEVVSAAATAALNKHDATIGQLISFGTITPQKNRRGVTRQIVALPTGEVGNILRLQLLTKERFGWKAEEHSRSLCYLQGLSIKGDSGFWNEDAVAIQQVCFAQSEDSGSFLAVRLRQRIALFHPAYRSHPAAAVRSPLYNLPPSVLHIRPFYSVWTKDTGGIAHADVAFNPHYQRQFAVVSQDSSWSVWDIDGNQQTYVVTGVASGNMNVEENADAEDEIESGSFWKEDGWARIMWVGDANTILICNRRHLKLVNLKEPARLLKFPQVVNWSSAKTPSKHWILDAKRHPTNEKQLFVLTSVRLYLLSIEMSDGLHSGFWDADVAIIMSWTHFRSDEDVTLQLHVQSMSDSETGIFVHSRLDALITVYRLVAQESEMVPFCSFGPTALRLDNWGNELISKKIVNFDISHLEFKSAGTRPHSSDHAQEERGFQFYHFSALFDDLSVAQTILCSLNPSEKGISLQDAEATTWSKVVRKPAVTYGSDVVSSDEDDFVEPDGLMGAQNLMLKSRFQQHQSIRWKTLQRVFNFGSLYDTLASSQIQVRSGEESLPETVDILTLTEEVMWRLSRVENVTPFTLGTLQEYAEAVVTVDDIDEGSARVDELYLMDLTEHDSSLELRKIASDYALGLVLDETQDPLSLSSLYDLILQTWIAPLPRTIPARIRQTKEYMARRIATGVVLASTRVRQIQETDDMAVTPPGPSQDSAVALSSSLPQYTSQSDWPSKSSQSHEPEVLFTAATSSTISINPLARLSEHLHINDTKPPAVSSNVAQVLSHWQLGASPSIYDWEATERAFAEELELEIEGTQKLREKAKRKKDRQVKRQKKENQLFAGKVESGKAGSQPHMFREQMPRSSPGPAFASSSQVPTQSQIQSFGGVQSQVESGKHGGRPLKKKKGKSRMSGF